MKRSPDYYHNRKLLKELKSDNIVYRPTVKETRRWFDILNEQIFGNKLEYIECIKVKRLKDAHAYFNYWPKHEEQDPEIDMNYKYQDKKMFVEILAHEMIHYFQYSFDEPLGHGPTFWAWRDNLKLKGLTLHKVA